ncbi:MAG TPA: glycosyl transferase family 1 [Cytophagales bacterium]|nr:glycosyl transferase family 1 [Cytophagales bacterium]
MMNEHIVVIGQQDWESTIGSNNVNIAKEFAKQNKVLYVNIALDRITLCRNKQDVLVRKKLRFVTQKHWQPEPVLPNLWVLYPSVVLESVNWLPKGLIYDFFNKRNNQKLAKSIIAACQKLGFDSFVLFNDSLISRAVYLKKLLQPSFYIYYSRDNFSSQPYFQKHALEEEKNIIKEANLVVANSTQLAQIAKQHNPHSYDIGQGCDLNLFKATSPANVPEMAAFPRPIIGYAGFLTAMRLDIELLVHIATSRPCWSFVLIGPEDDAFRRSSLHHLANVYFLGNKKPEELPAYISQFDVAINPQLVNELTNGNYPRKIDEYLAMGKPVVATQTEFMHYFSGFCHLPHNLSSWIESIEKALAEKHETQKKERIAFAHTHSWEKNVQKIYKLVAEIRDNKKFGAV